MAMQYEHQLIPHGQNQPQSLPSVLQQGLGRTGWHNETDEEQRQHMATHIFNIFQQRKPTSEQYASRLPDFVRRLEDVLYKQAKSLAEYVDLTTLDNRLQAVALHFVGRPSAQVNTSGSPPQAAGSQGLPGHDMLQHPLQQQQQHQMAPNSLPAMVGGVPQMQQQQAQQQQQQVGNLYAPINPALNGNYVPQPSPAFSPGGGAIRTNYMSNGMPSAAPPPGDSSMPGSGFTPRQSPAAITSNGVYGSNVPGLPVMSNGAPVLRNSANRDWMGQNLQQHGSMVGAPAGALPGHINGMVPSPQLSTSGMMPMPMGSNGPSSSMGNAMVPSNPFFGSQGHQAPNHHSSAYEMGPTTGNGAAKMMPITTNNNYHSPSNSQHHLVPVPTAAGGPGTASGFAPQSSGGNGGGLGPGQANGFVPQNQSNSGGMGAAFGSLQSASGNGGMGGSSFGGQSINGNGGGQNGLGNGFPQNQLAVLERQGGASGFNGQNPLLTEGPAFGSGAQNSGGNNGGSLGPALGGFGQLSTVGSGNGPASRATSGGGGAVGPPAPPSLLPGVPDDATEEMRHTHVQKQQRWLLYLRHCAKCHVPGNECSLKQQCKFGKQLWQHILSCQETECPFPRCTTSKELLKHHQRCQNISCPICAPVKEYVRKTRIATAAHSEQAQQRMQQQQQQQLQNGGQVPLLNGMMPINNGNGHGGNPQMHMHPHTHQQQHPQHSQPHSQHNQHSQQQQPDMRMTQEQLAQQRQQRSRQGPDHWPSGSQPSSAVSGQKRGHGMIEDEGPADRKPAMMVDSKGFAMPSASGSGMHNNGPVHDNADPAIKEDPAEMDRKRQAHDDLLGKNTGTSLLEAYEPRMIHDHMVSLQQAAQAQRETQAEAAPSDICKVCLLTKLSFEPPVIYCTQCACKIKRGQTYYSHAVDASNDIKGSWCHNCYQEPKGDKLNFDGAPLKKSDLVKRKNDEEIEEAWVQCDHCEYWVHQVCGMFNKGKNNPQELYLCPECLLLGLRMGRRQRILSRPQSMLEAKDLPRCYLSDQLQDRLDRQLDIDWKRRQQEQGTHNVPRCEPITVRVINSVKKICSVRHEFAESFRNEGYPTEFPYRQRVILLFQNLDGVDVCLFCLYVQEYGKDCPAPNTNCVYLSYLDSIKYFRPEVPAAGGNASVGLRTFAYHQLLIGYLAHIKKLGFEQMYIWACPPMAGDDYILYCHPSKQKTPRSDRLRQWYIEMLKTAKEEGIVKHITTLWDTYFEGGKDHRSERCSATSIPYLEGDYWPGEAENLLTESLKAANKSNKKGSGLATGGASGSSARGQAAKGKRYGSGPTTADELLMGRLGEILGGNMKDDFIVVHLTEVCTFCRAHLRGGNLIHRYRSHTPLKPAPMTRFEGIRIEQGPSVPINPYHQLSICDVCYHDEDHRSHSQQQMTRLPQGLTIHDLSTSMVEDLQLQQIMADTDIDMDNEFFETRQTFLSLCQGNHYQFDTLRRAKHSSMMVLYHLHNPSAPAFTTSCNHCQREIEPGAGFRCTVCPDFDICANCKLTTTHAHAFMAHVKKAHETQIRLTDAERRERHEQLQRTMALLIHACSCHSAQCQSNSCRKVKALMAHSLECVPSVSGGCLMCRKMWVLLNLHSKCCNKANCSVPRCSELKEMRRRQTCRQEDQRRSAYNNMAHGQQQ